MDRDELKRFLNHDFQSIAMELIEQIERKEIILLHNRDTVHFC